MRSGTYSRRFSFTPWLFLLPFLIFFSIFVLIPLIWGFLISFQSASLTGPWSFVGMQNFIRALEDEIFWQAIRNTAFYVVGLIAMLAFALFLALSINHVGRGRTLYRALLFLPYIIPVAIHGMVFNFLLQPRIGFISQLFKAIELKQLATQSFLGNVNTALPTVVGVWTYVYFGYMMLILYTGLQDIPSEIMEAAIIDGAGPWARLWKVTVPLLSNTLVYVTVVGIILAFQVFPLVWVMTGYGYGHGAGGPANRTLSLDLYIFTSAFRDRALGYASAMGMIMLVLTFVITAVPFRLLPEIRYD